jgi:hypothetical protein
LYRAFDAGVAKVEQIAASSPASAFEHIARIIASATDGWTDRLTPRRRNTTDTLNFVNYFRVTPDNRLLFGGRARFATSNAASDAKTPPPPCRLPPTP